MTNDQIMQNLVAMVRTSLEYCDCPGRSGRGFELQTVAVITDSKEQACIGVATCGNCDSKIIATMEQGQNYAQVHKFNDTTELAA